MSFICNVIIKNRDRNSQISKHYEEAGLYLNCSICKVNKHISYFRLKTNKCRLCVYLQKYRLGSTRERFNEYVKIHTICERASPLVPQAGCIWLIFFWIMNIVVDKAGFPVTVRFGSFHRRREGEWTEYKKEGFRSYFKNLI